jgi:hypothetical protein
VPSSNGSSEEVVYAFLDRVFNKFDVPTNVFIDQGMRFHGEFQKLCPNHLLIIVQLHETILSIWVI